MLGELFPTLAQYLAYRKAPILERISSPEIRLSFLNFFARSALFGTEQRPHFALI